jgi:hypothetical protein
MPLEAGQMRFSRPISTTKRLLTAAVLFSLALVAGCNEYVTTERNPEVPIPKHATWAWRPVEAQPLAAHEGRPVISRDEPNQRSKPVPQSEASTEILRGQIRVAITKELKGKGFKEVTDPNVATFLVDYHIAVRDQSAAVPVGYGGGYPGVVCGPYGCVQSWGWGPPAYGYQNIKFRTGTMVFDFLQASTHKVAFRAIGNKPVGEGLTTFKQSDVNSLVGAVLWKLAAGQ